MPRNIRKVKKQNHRLSMHYTTHAHSNQIKHLLQPGSSRTQLRMLLNRTQWALIFDACSYDYHSGEHKTESRLRLYFSGPPRGELLRDQVEKTRPRRTAQAQFYSGLLGFYLESAASDGTEPRQRAFGVSGRERHHGLEPNAWSSEPT